VVLGITKAKKRIKRDLGITALHKPIRVWTNAKRRIKARAEFRGDAGRLIRNGVPTPGGCLVVMVAAVGTVVAVEMLLW
jgi:hypothetical protein